MGCSTWCKINRTQTKTVLNRNEVLAGARTSFLFVMDAFAVIHRCFAVIFLE